MAQDYHQGVRVEESNEVTFNWIARAALRWYSTARQNKHLTDKNGATPHWSAAFASGTFYIFIFLQTGAPASAAAGFLSEFGN